MVQTTDPTELVLDRKSCSASTGRDGRSQIGVYVLYIFSVVIVYQEDGVANGRVLASLIPEARVDTV